MMGRIEEGAEGRDPRLTACIEGNVQPARATITVGLDINDLSDRRAGGIDNRAAGKPFDPKVGHSNRMIRRSHRHPARRQRGQDRQSCGETYLSHPVEGHRLLQPARN